MPMIRMLQTSGRVQRNDVEEEPEGGEGALEMWSGWLVEGQV